MPVTVRYVAVRELKVGDDVIAPGQEVPVSSFTQGIIEALISNGDMRMEVVDGDTAPSEAVQEPQEEQEQEDSAEDVGEAESESEPAENEDKDEASDEESFDPGRHTVEDVLAYVNEHPEERADIRAAEENGRARKSLLASLLED